MNPDKNKVKINTTVWHAVSIISAIFAIVICILVVANFVQINRLDPVNTEVMNSLVERLNKNPQDQQLRNEVREFDLLARKAYFTTQRQIRMGGYLLLFSLIIFVIARQLVIAAEKKITPADITGKEDRVVLQQKARKWVTVGGIFIALITIVFAYLSHEKLGQQFSAISNSETTLIDTLSMTDATTINNKSNALSHNDNLSLSDTTIKNQDTAQENTEIENSTVPAHPTEEMKTNFPGFRGAGGNGYAWQKNVPTTWDGASGKNILWKVSVPLQGYNSPVVWDQKVFLTGAEAGVQQVYCFDANSGKMLWKTDIKDVPGTPATSPKVTDDTGLSAPTCATDGTLVYTIFATGDMAALDMGGKIHWSKNLGLPANHYGHSSSLVVWKDIVIVQYDQKKGAQVLGISGKSGETLWSTDRKVKASWASPIVVNTGNRVETILISDPFVASYDPATGKELWKVDCIYGEVGASVTYANGIVFAMNEYAKLVAIDIGTEPKILWEDNEFLSDVPSPVASKDHAFIPTSYGVIACYKAREGGVVWSHDFGVGFYSSPILVGDVIYWIDKKGVTHIFKASDSYTSVSEPALGEKTDCTPAFSNGKIFIRTEKNLICIGKRSEG